MAIVSKLSYIPAHSHIRYSEDKSDHAGLAQRLAVATGWPVFVPNYRLSNTRDAEFLHPAHAEDALEFLEFLLEWKPENTDLKSAMDPRSVYLIGHSCSAHMLASIILDSDFITPTLSPSSRLLQAVKGLVFSEGIYNIDTLLERYPDYHGWFIDDAFGAQQSYSAYDVNLYRLRKSAAPDTPPASWLIIHSKGDELVNVGQSEEMYDHLSRLYGDLAGAHISRSTDRLVASHDDILRGDEDYLDIVQTFVERVNNTLQSV